MEADRSVARLLSPAISDRADIVARSSVDRLT
jgi:hypothetical protein